jgi:isopentenyl-diphosphate delta-isomerase
VAEIIQSRKDQHLDLCIGSPVGFRARSNLLEQVELIHDALPDMALSQVDCSCTLLGRRLEAPIIIAAMTGGTERAATINRDLAGVAESLGIGFAFGSQRRQLVNGSPLGFEVRDVAPSVLLLGNIGVVQAREASAPAIETIVRQSGCDALCVHLNPAMELVQPEGDLDFREGLATLRRLVEQLDFPIVAKETGCGVSRSVARRLVAAGVELVDVSGAGGTSWVGVETLRTQGAAAGRGEVFWDWGIPTAASVVQCDGLGLGTIATGGLNSGLDALRALALGASACGYARAVLLAWDQGGRDGAEAYLRRVIAELRMGMLLTGSRDLDALRRQPLMLGPDLARWVPADAPLGARLLG